MRDLDMKALGNWYARGRGRLDGEADRRLEGVERRTKAQAREDRVLEWLNLFGHAHADAYGEGYDEGREDGPTDYQLGYARGIKADEDEWAAFMSGQKPAPKREDA